MKVISLYVKHIARLNKRSVISRGIFALALACSALVYNPAQTSAALPPDFEKSTYASNINNPTTLRFAPNGDLFVSEQSGAIKLIRGGNVLSTPVLTVDTINDHEKGLLGIELDKGFATNGYLYASYTHSSGYARLSRFTVVNDKADPATEKIFYQSDQIASIYHNANDIHHGPDGKIWWTVGDNLNTGNSQSLQTIHGKIARFDVDGSSANDNPWHGQGDKVDETYALGFRNPYRFTFLPNGKAIVGDVGGAKWEELNVVEPGANYGWPIFEGNCGSCGYVNPVFAYPHPEGPDPSAAVSALAVYTGNTFPAQYKNVLFYGDYAQNHIRYLVFDANYGSVISDNAFDDAAGTIVDLQQGPDGSLYYADIFANAIRKISAVSGNRTPIAQAGADPIAGLAPLQVNFSSAGSSDPDNDQLTYAWDFKDGATATEANPSHTFTTNGTYDVTLTVSDGQKTAAATIKVTVGNRLPTATIDTPIEGAKYNGGDIISYAGSASDPEDGILPASAFSWKIVFHHQIHTHPFIGPVDGVKSGTFAIGRDTSNEFDTWYRIELTVTDSAGLKSTVTRDINPNLAQLTVTTNTPGASFTFDGKLFNTEYTQQSVVGVEHGLNVISPQQLGDKKYRFSKWSDNGAQQHTITVPATNSTVTAELFEVAALPAAWQTTDVGNPALKGNADYDPNRQAFIVDGAGNDIWSNQDQFRYVYQGLSGDGEISARVTAQTNTHGHAKAGVMIKESTAAFSPYAFMGVTPETGYKFQWTFELTSIAGGTYEFPNAWVKVKRAGNVMTVYKSADGSNWTQIGSKTVAMAADATLGLFVTSHNGAKLSTVVFDNVKVTKSGSPTPTPTTTPTPTPSAPPTPTPGTEALPSPWVGENIGSPMTEGSGAYDSTNKVFTLKGAGTDVWADADQMYLAHQPLNGDGEIVARVTSQTNTNEWAKAGVIIKESTSPGSPYAMAAVTPGHGYAFQWNFTGAMAGGSFTFPNAWVKMTRSGNTFTAYNSTDGTNWTQIGVPQTVTMGSSARIGLFVNSHDWPQLSTVTFDNVKITGSVAPTPTPSTTPTPTPTPGISTLPTPWTNNDIGSPTLAGSASYDTTSNQFTIKGAGKDIWDTNDQFHYAHQPLTGDGEIVARVTSQTKTHPSAKAGVIFKESTTAFAPYAMIGITPDNGYKFQWSFLKESASGGTYTSPDAWVKLKRVGNVMSAFKSADGSNWTQVGSNKTVAMNSTITAGLFVTSHNANALSTATFDNVTVTAAGSQPNIAPTATNQSASTKSDTPVNITLTGTDPDGKPQPLTYSIVAQPTNGTLSGVAPNATYTPKAGFVGNDSFTFKVNDGAADSAPATVSITVTGQAIGALPSPWLSSDVGSPTLAGSAAHDGSNNIFTLKGAGNDIWDKHDQFQYAYQPLNGDGEIVARVTSQTRTHASAKAGVMIKASTTAFAPYAMIGITPDNGYKFQWTFLLQSASGGTYTLPNAWVKLTRTGNVVKAYKSADGVNWTQVGSDKTIELTPDATIGLFVTSHNAGALSTATFDNVSVTP